MTLYKYRACNAVASVALVNLICCFETFWTSQKRWTFWISSFASWALIAFKSYNGSRKAQYKQPWLKISSKFQIQVVLQFNWRAEKVNKIKIVKVLIKSLINPFIFLVTVFIRFFNLTNKIFVLKAHSKVWDNFW